MPFFLTWRSRHCFMFSSPWAYTLRHAKCEQSVYKSRRVCDSESKIPKSFFLNPMMPHFVILFLGWVRIMRCVGCGASCSQEHACVCDNETKKQVSVFLNPIIPHFPIFVLGWVCIMRCAGCGANSLQKHARVWQRIQNTKIQNSRHLKPEDPPKYTNQDT